MDVAGGLRRLLAVSMSVVCSNQFKPLLVAMMRNARSEASKGID